MRKSPNNNAHAVISVAQRRNVTMATLALVLAGDVYAAAQTVSFPAQSHFWPWWLGAFTLGIMTLGSWWMARQALGASGSWERVCDWKLERKREQQEQAITTADSDALMAALMAETVAQFGADAVAPNGDNNTASASINNESADIATARAPVSAHLLFLGMVFVGGLLGSVAGGGPSLHFDMGNAYSSFFGSGASSWLTLFIGGLLVGFGARLGGGCTVGHGLTGMSTLQIGSIVGTMTFFGTAIVVSLLLEQL